MGATVTVSKTETASRSGPVTTSCACGSACVPAPSRSASGLVDQTKIITAASELARNTLDYGGGGEVRSEIVQAGARKGVRLTFEDQGPGISDIEKAMTDHYTTGRGLGLGLGGAKRLSNEFHIESTPGVGTRVMIARWK